MFMTWLAARKSALRVLAASFMACAWGGAWGQQPAGAPRECPSDEMVVTLLGTGTPSLSPNRFGASNLVQACGMNLLFDAGRGASIRLAQAGVRPSALDAVFLTHFHSDHVNGLADVWMSGYVGARSQRRQSPMPLYGPRGTLKLAEGMRAAHHADVEIRSADEGVAAAIAGIETHEFDAGVVFERHGVRVTAFHVLHGEKIKPAVGYRVDYRGRSVVISGDTTYERNVVQAAKGVDLLIHEVGVGPANAQNQPNIQQVLAHHTSPEEAGRVFQEAGPRLAVYTHMVRLGAPGMASLDQIVERTRSTYDGPLVIGEDLLRFRIGRAITVVPLLGE